MPRRKKGRKRVLPKHIGMTMREYKRKKRTEFKALKKAMYEYSKDAIYMPEEALISFNKAEEQLNKTYESLKAWWGKA